MKSRCLCLPDREPGRVYEERPQPPSDEELYFVASPHSSNHNLIPRVSILPSPLCEIHNLSAIFGCGSNPSLLFGDERYLTIAHHSASIIAAISQTLTLDTPLILDGFFGIISLLSRSATAQNILLLCTYTLTPNDLSHLIKTQSIQVALFEGNWTRSAWKNHK